MNIKDIALFNVLDTPLNFRNFNELEKKLTKESKNR